MLSAAVPWPWPVFLSSPLATWISYRCEFYVLKKETSSIATFVFIQSTSWFFQQLHNTTWEQRDSFPGTPFENQSPLSLNQSGCPLLDCLHVLQNHSSSKQDRNVSLLSHSHPFLDRENFEVSLQLIYLYSLLVFTFLNVDIPSVTQMR